SQSVAVERGSVKPGTPWRECSMLQLLRLGQADGVSIFRSAAASRSACVLKSLHRRLSSQGSFQQGNPREEEIRRLRTTKDVLAYFLAQRDKLIPADVCCILEALWSRSQEHEDIKAAKKQLFNDADFMAIMKDVLFKLDRYSAPELPRLLGALFDMRWNDRQLFKIVEPMVIQHLPSMDCGSLPLVAHSFVGIRCGSRLLFNELVHRCFQSEHFTPEGVASLTAAFAKAPHKPKTFLIGFAPVVSQHLPSFTADQLQRVLLAYSEWPAEIPAEFMEQLAHFLVQDNAQMIRTGLPAQQLVTILRFLALWSARAKAAREDPGARRAFEPIYILCAKTLVAACDELTTEESSQAMWAYCKMKLVPKVLFQRLYSNILPSFQQLSLPSLAPCLLNTARAASGQMQFWDDAHPTEAITTRDLPRDYTLFEDRRLLLAAETHIVRCMGDIAPRDLTAVVQAYSLAHVGSPGLFSVLQRAAMEQCRQLPAEQLSSQLSSFAMLRLGPSFAREAQIDILDRLAQLPVTAVCDILWAFCVLRHRDPHFFKALLGILSPGSVANRRCAWLCPALLEIRTHFPDMDPEGLDRYMGYVQPDFRHVQLRQAAPESARKSLRSCLEQAGLQCTELVEVDGYIVDVLVESGDLEKPVAIQYHSAPRTLHLSTGEPLGGTMMKQMLAREISSLGGWILCCI
ncbi:unnamed protein product, partial [Effrenium voratum]